MASEFSRIGKIFPYPTPTASNLCRDGYYSDRNGRGACSYHGGLAMGGKRKGARTEFKAPNQILPFKIGDVFFYGGGGENHKTFITILEIKDFSNNGLSIVETKRLVNTRKGEKLEV